MSFVELGDICEFLDHKRKPVSEELRKSGRYPYYGANGQQGWIDDYIFDEPLVLLAEDGGNFGSNSRPIAYKISGKTWVNNHAHVLRPNHNCDVDYITHVLSFYDVSKIISGTTRPKLTKGNAELIRIPLPSLPEQRRISEQLEQADRLRRRRRYTLELSDTFLPAAFLEYFGDPVRNEKKWETKTLGEMANKITDGEHLNPLFVQTGIPIVMAEQVEDFGVNLTSCKMVSPDDFTKFTKKCAPHFGDILVVSRGATIGRNCVVNITAPFCMMGSVILIKPNCDMATPEFLAAQLKSASFYEALQKTSGSSAQQAIYISQLRENKVVLPPLPLQQKFAALVERHERLRATQREALRQAEHLFQTLLHNAFTVDL
jgi:type I restriction enzyme S subunit